MVVDLEGRIVFGEECDNLRASIKEFLQAGQPLVLNMSGVSYVDSGGVGCLVGLFTTAKGAGREIKFAAANEKVQHVLKITRLLPVIGMFPDEASAIAACKQRATA